MNIYPVDETKRLFRVENILPEYLYSRLLGKVAWQDIPYGKQPGQESWPRRLLNSDMGILAEVNETIMTLKDEIGKCCGVSFNYASTGWWYDEPGFTVSIHTDGELPSSMQIFWVMPTDRHGTKFYTHRDGKEVRYAPPALSNTGYIMLNKPNQDGSQPLHWHGMLVPVPQNTFRVCSYTTFGDYTIL